MLKRVTFFLSTYGALFHKETFFPHFFPRSNPYVCSIDNSLSMTTIMGIVIQYNGKYQSIATNLKRNSRHFHKQPPMLCHSCCLHGNIQLMRRFSREVTLPASVKGEDKNFIRSNGSISTDMKQTIPMVEKSYSWEHYNTHKIGRW